MLQPGTRACSVAMYSAVAPVYGGTESAAASSTAAPSGPPLSAAQQRLADLKAKLSTARSKNHKEVVEEDRRNKMGPEALQKEREMRRNGGYPADQKLQSLGVFSEPSSCGVGTRGGEAFGECSPKCWRHAR